MKYLPLFIFCFFSLSLCASDNTKKDPDYTSEEFKNLSEKNKANGPSRNPLHFQHRAKTAFARNDRRRKPARSSSRLELINSALAISNGN